MSTHAKRAAETLAELYVFAAVAEILEGSTAPRSDSGQKVSAKIIGECQKQQQRCLRAYDKHISLASKAQEESDGK